MTNLSDSMPPNAPTTGLRLPYSGPSGLIPVSGPVAWLGVETIDGRVIEAISVSSLPFPLLGLCPRDMALSGCVLAGRVTDVKFETDGSVWIVGTMYKEFAPHEDARFGCGMDIGDVTSTRIWENDDDIEHITGHLQAVTVYLDGSLARPAFPDAHIRRQDNT